MGRVKRSARFICRQGAVDQDTASRPPEMGKDRPGAVDATEEISFDDLLVSCGEGFVEALVKTQFRDSDPDVDSPKYIRSLSDQTHHIPFVRDIGGDRQGSSSVSLAGSGQLPQLLWLPACQGQLSALTGDLERKFTPNAGGGARNDKNQIPDSAHVRFS